MSKLFLDYLLDISLSKMCQPCTFIILSCLISVILAFFAQSKQFFPEFLPNFFPNDRNLLHVFLFIEACLLILGVIYYSLSHFCCSSRNKDGKQINKDDKERKSIAHRSDSYNPNSRKYNP